MARIKPSIMKKLKDYTAEINLICRADKVVLFGSYAKGTQSKDSDIDIAVFSKDINDSNRHRYMTLFLKHSFKYLLDIQPIAYSYNDYTTPADDFVAKEIRKNGIVLYSRE